MARSRGQEGTPDRLAAVLEELEAVRRAPGWVPSEHTVVDEPRSKVAELPRRVAETRRARHAAGSGSDGDEVRPREPLLRPPEPLIGAQVAPSRLAVIGALILVTVAALVFGGRVLWARASARPHPVTSTGASMVSTGRAGSPSAATAAGSTASAAAAQPGFGAASEMAEMHGVKLGWLCCALTSTLLPEGCGKCRWWSPHFVMADAVRSQAPGPRHRLL